MKYIIGILILVSGFAQEEQPSRSSQYFISFPTPNDCYIGPIEASSRSQALYRGISKGGFTLKPSKAGLTVWTFEEWQESKARFGVQRPEWFSETAKCR